MIPEQSSKPGAAGGRKAGSALRSPGDADKPLVSELEDLGRLAANGIEPGSPQEESIHSSMMTIASFVELKFAPEHINLKRYPSRLFYQAILKHVIRPEQVERIFQMNTSDPRRRLKAIHDWPYLDEMRLCDVRHEHVSRITSAATAHGYSVVTVRHIRNVIGTIFSHAIRTAPGDSPIQPGQTHTKTS